MDILDQILKARESRALLRKELADDKLITISLSLNIPGYPKSNEAVSYFFSDVLEELKRWLTANRIHLKLEKEIIQIDEAGDFFLAPVYSNDINAENIKDICEKFETEHPIGRLIDVDVFNNKGEPISSGKSKACLFCDDQPAIVCRRDEAHSIDELHTYAIEMIIAHIYSKRKDWLVKKLPELALKSILHEISLSPKPGLVDTFNSGVHKDMDYNTFIRSTSVLSTYFKDFVELATEKELETDEVLPAIRNIGLLMEDMMFNETGGVNTQKGIIFLMGLSIYSVAKELIDNDQLELHSIQSLIQEICTDMTGEYKEQTGNNATHGEKCFEQYGKKAGGIREEAEKGLPVVFDHALPLIKELDPDVQGQTETKSINNVLTKVLLKIIAENNDSNIIYRSNPETLIKLQSIAKNALNSNSDKEFKNLYNELDEFCQANKISPGGSADLLAVSIFFYLIEKEMF